MSDSDKPQDTPPTPPNPPQNPPELHRRLRPEREPPSRSPRNMEKVPSLDHEMIYGAVKKKGVDSELDRELEREMMEAMGGVSETDMKQLLVEGDRIVKKPAQAAPPGPRTGK